MRFYESCLFSLHNCTQKLKHFVNISSLRQAHPTRGSEQHHIKASVLIVRIIPLIIRGQHAAIELAALFIRLSNHSYHEGIEQRLSEVSEHSETKFLFEHHSRANDVQTENLLQNVAKGRREP